MFELYVWKEGRKDGCGTDGRHLEHLYTREEVASAKKRWKKHGYVGFTVSIRKSLMEGYSVIEEGEL